MTPNATVITRVSSRSVGSPNRIRKPAVSCCQMLADASSPEGVSVTRTPSRITAVTAKQVAVSTTTTGAPNSTYSPVPSRGLISRSA